MGNLNLQTSIHKGNKGSKSNKPYLKVEVSWKSKRPEKEHFYQVRTLNRSHTRTKQKVYAMKALISNSISKCHWYQQIMPLQLCSHETRRCSDTAETICRWRKRVPGGRGSDPRRRRRVETGAERTRGRWRKWGRGQRGWCKQVSGRVRVWIWTWCPLRCWPGLNSCCLPIVLTFEPSLWLFWNI